MRITRPKMPMLEGRTIVIAVVVILVVVLLFFWFNRRPSSPDEVTSDDWQVYKNEQLGFEVRYPRDVRERDGKIELTGSDFGITTYAGERIQAVIDRFKENEISGMTIAEERDVRINTCTARKISVQVRDDQQHHYYFVARGGDTFMFDWEDTDSETDKAYVQEILNSFTCN